MLGVSQLLNGEVTEGDALRYGRHSGRLPSNLLHYSQDKRPVVVWTSTRTCNLHCAHCYTDSHDEKYPDELTTEEAFAMVDDLAALGSPVLLVSGGEPLRRHDLLEVAAHARERGMRVVLSTNGTLITDEMAKRLAEVGVSYVGISIDGRPATHDKFRGMLGAFDASMAAIERCKSEGIKVGLRYTLTRSNIQDLPWLFELMRERDVHRLCIYHLAPTGRGARLKGFAPSAEESRDAVSLIFTKTQQMAAEGFPVDVLTADNHADAAFLLLHLQRTQPERAESVRQLLGWNGGNQSGIAIACVAPNGDVYADQFWRWRPLGNLRERPFSSIYRDDPPPLVQQLRDRKALLPERCQGCAFLDVCNGNFRSRAEATTGDLWAMDPLCYLNDDEVAGRVGEASRA
ncbi:MAG: radical SAM protein [Dehalococcoidia bacterium]|nr:MAG: radical SAM protein [Dehalococcoidia bacterium]